MKSLYENFFKNKESSDPVLQVMGQVPIFENLTPKELKDLTRLTHERSYKANEPVFKKLAPGEGMYVILKGTVEIKDPDSNTTFATLGSGDFFGELALLDQGTRSVMAVPTVADELISYILTVLLYLMIRNPELGNNMLLNISRELRERLRRTNLELKKSN